MARKKKETIDQNDIQIEQIQDNKENNTTQNKEQNCVHNKQNKDIIVPDLRTLEQKLQSYKRKLRRI